MKLLLLGSGTSTGVPRIGNDWGSCDPDEPRNRRTRVSIIVESDAGNRLLVDTSTDLRQQLLANRIDRVDAVFWTHDHADHCHGIDDLRVMRYGRGGPLPGYASDETVRLRQRFAMSLLASSAIRRLPRSRRWRTCGCARALPWRIARCRTARRKSTGYRFDCDGKSIGYATDFSEITRDMVSLFHGCDILVVDCLKREPHPTHAHLAMSLELVEAARAGQAVLTHLDKTMDYATVSREIPDHATVAHDGLELIA